MRSEGPAESRAYCGKTCLVIVKASGIGVTNAFDTADDHLVMLFDSGETNTAVERQIFFGGVDDVQDMAPKPGRGEPRKRRVDGIERRQKVTDQNQHSGARQRLERR